MNEERLKMLHREFCIMVSKFVDEHQCLISEIAWLMDPGTTVAFIAIHNKPYDELGVNVNDILTSKLAFEKKVESEADGIHH